MISISAIWRFFTWLPSFILRKIFTKSRLADLILVDIRPRHENVTVNLGELASFQIWLQMINLSPFEIELDRAELEFQCGGAYQKSPRLKKMTIKSGEVVDNLYFTESIIESHANQIAKQLDSHQSSIEMNLEFNCKLHNFSKSTGRLSGINTRFVNEQTRLNKS
ncbi:MAG: hypothetical protein BMS9Abin02_1957 [Anaerolineae bacterium]|nr:MAG: hypothetical protein BMS9Abin02_1957 [Anaerolineae bacterium]